jgi:hypothetical protein
VADRLATRWQDPLFMRGLSVYISDQIKQRIGNLFG